MNTTAGARFGPYEVVEQIGHGGMGLVFHARDTRLHRDVALKIIADSYITAGTPTAASHERFLREARSSSALNHPNICTIYDVGEQDGRPYLVMELMQGEMLKQAIHGRALPIEQVLDYGIQLMNALAEAHAHGILHRDIKPANLFLVYKQPGRAQLKVLDFGLAKHGLVTADASQTNSIGDLTGTLPGATLTVPGSTVGTVAYMSPEQARGEPLDARSDLFSAGAVLYEMATGSAPFYGQSIADIFAALLTRDPEPARAKIPLFPKELDRILAKALAKDKAMRYQSADELLADLQQVQASLFGATGTIRNPPAVSGRGRGRRWAAYAILAVLLLAAIVAASYFLRPRHQAVNLTQKDSVILSDFVNQTGDPVFDLALKQALAFQLDQSPYLKIVGDQHLRNSLQYLGKSPDEKMTPALAREIGEREGVRAIITGTISGLGNQYLIALEAENTNTGEIFAREEAQANGKDHVLDALHTAATGLRKKLGESLGSIQQLNAPFGEATTTSLEAFRAYALGEAAHARSNDAKAINFYKSAVELDPDFAMAYARLSAAYGALSASSQANAYLTKAFQLSSKVSQRERLYISARYYNDVPGDLPKAIETYELYGQTYPNDAIVPNNLSVIYLLVGQFDKAYNEALRAIELDPNRGSEYVNAIEAATALDKLPEARQLFLKAVALNLDTDASLRGNWVAAAYMLNDHDAIAKQLQWAQDQADGYIVDFQAATLLDMEGRFTAGGVVWQHGLAKAHDQKLEDVEANGLADIAADHALAGSCSGVADQAARALKLDRERLTLFPSAIALAFCGDAGRAQSISRDLVKRFPQDTLVNHVYAPEIDAAVALRKGKPADALIALEPAANYDSAGLGAYLRGLAHLGLKEGSAAEEDFNFAATHKGVCIVNQAPVAMSYPMSLLGLARAHALQGNKAKAKSAYQNFFAAWKNADPTQPALMAAHRDGGSF